MGYHATGMDQIAKEAASPNSRWYNHFSGQANLFTCAIESCEGVHSGKQFELTPESTLGRHCILMCQRALGIIYLPEALKLNRVLFELAAEQSPSPSSF